MGSPVSQPRIGIRLLPAALVDAFADRRDLIVGFTAVGGTATSEVLQQNVQNLTNAQLISLFGTGELYYRIQYWRSGNGGYSPLDVLPISPTTPAFATASFQFTGAAIEDGTLVFEILDAESTTVTLNVSDGDANTAIAANLNTLLSNVSNAPWTVATVTDTTTLTSIDGSAFPDLNKIKVTGSVANVSIVTTQFTGGGNANVLDGDLFDAIAGIRYTGINWPEYQVDDLNLLANELDARFNVTAGIFDGIGFMGQNADAASLISEALTHNTQTIVIGGNQLDGDDLPVIIQPADWIMAYFQGIRARRLTPGASIADFIVSTNGPLDNTGGPALASLPYFNTALALTPVTIATEQFDFTEQGQLENGGVSSWGVNLAGSEMITGPMVTTWTTDAAGNPNDSFKYLNYVDTGSACREIFFNTLKATYAQSRLTEGDLTPGRSMANAESIKSELLRIYRALANQALTQAGGDAESFFSQNTTVTVDLATRSVTIAGPLPIVTQLGSIDYDLQLAFTIGSTGTQITF